MEKVIVQLTDHLETNHLNESLQRAYPRKHNAKTALTHVHNDIMCSFNDKVVLLALWDLSTAFDTRHHGLLIRQLQNLAIAGNALPWFESYLTGQAQVINIKGHHSMAQPLSSGIPQGSVLGLILFTLYTASLGALMHAHHASYHLYANDTDICECLTRWHWWCSLPSGSMHLQCPAMDVPAPSKDEQC